MDACRTNDGIAVSLDPKGESAFIELTPAGWSSVQRTNAHAALHCENGAVSALTITDYVRCTRKGSCSTTQLPRTKPEKAPAWIPIDGHLVAATLADDLLVVQLAGEKKARFVFDGRAAGELVRDKSRFHSMPTVGGFRSYAVLTIEIDDKEYAVAIRAATDPKQVFSGLKDNR
jgi:hypothetical protein